jgi:hypothetical protein
MMGAEVQMMRRKDSVKETASVTVWVTVWAYLKAAD